MNKYFGEQVDRLLAAEERRADEARRQAEEAERRLEEKRRFSNTVRNL